MSKQKVFIVVPASVSNYKKVVTTKTQIIVPISTAFYRDLINEHFSFQEYKVCILWGAYGSSKTRTAVIREVILGLCSPVKIVGLMMRKTRVSIKHSIFAEFRNCIDNLGLTKFFKFNITECSITNKVTGTTYISLGMDEHNTDRVKGIANLKRIIADEISEFSPEELSVIFTRLRGEENDKLAFTGMFNPTARALHVKAFMELLESTHDASEVKFMYSNYKHNDFIDKDGYRKTLEISRLLNESEYLMAIGEILWAEVQNKNPFFPHFNIKYHVSEVAVYKHGLPLYFFCDFNAGDFACIIGQKSFSDNQRDSFFYVIDEILVTQDDIRGKDISMDVAMGQKIKQYALRLNCSDIYFGGDETAMSNSTKGVSGEIVAKQIGLGWQRILFGNAKDENGIIINPNLPRANLEHGISYQLCNTAFMYHPNLKIHPQCERTIKEVSHARMDEKDMERNKITLAKKGGSGIEAQNFTDALRYFMHYGLHSYLSGNFKHLLK